ncbi:MAG TPA: hypothetical protein VHY22_00105 [Chthoniobacteraceae bacterium]|nr:hypothetical protein [Chthoniobacteraceae bacterium]
MKMENDVTDIIGIRTLVLSQIWQPSSSGLTQAEIDAESPDVPETETGVMLVGLQTRPYGGCYKTSWTFEGIQGDGQTVTFKNRDNSIDYGFDPGFSQMEIQKHPFFQQMLALYGGYADPESGRVIWPQFFPSTTTGSPGMPGSAASSSSQVPNTMFDFQDYFSMEGTYRYRYAALAIAGGDATNPIPAPLPATLYVGIGTIFETADLPGQPPPLQPDPDGTTRNWLKVPAPYKRRGTIYDITEMYWLSGRAGWPPPIYTPTWPPPGVI